MADFDSFYNFFSFPHVLLKLTGFLHMEVLRHSYKATHVRWSQATQFSLLFSCSVMSNSLHPMDCSMPGFPVLHYLPELAVTHVHQVGDAIQPSHPLSSPSPLDPNPSQHQSLFQSVNSSHEVAKVLEFQL